MFGLFKRRKDQPARTVMLAGGTSVNVVGAASYQAALDQISGGKHAEQAQHLCVATLVPQPRNPVDPNSVMVTIEGMTVGYLSRSDGMAYHQVLRTLDQRGAVITCNALITGGWNHEDDEGHFGVVLDLAPPARVLKG